MEQLLTDNLQLVHSFVEKKFDNYKYIYGSKDDMFQELCLKLLPKMKHYNSSFKISTFLYTLMNNIVLSAYKYKEFSNNSVMAQKVARNSDLILEYLPEKENMSLSDKLSCKADFQKVKKHLSKESYMFYILQYTYKEIAFELGSNSKAIRSRIERNIKKIKKLV